MEDDSPFPALRYRRLARFRRYRPPEMPEVDLYHDVFMDPPADMPPVEPGDDDYVPVIEDFVPSPPKPQSPLARMPAPESARPALACLLLFFIASLQYWTAAGDGGGWASHAALWRDGEWWRAFTALFTHADLGHLLSNTPLFVIFGWYLRAFFGPLAFPFGALLVGVLSNLATLWFYPAEARLVGASGMLYGMVALWLVLYVRFETVYAVGMRVFRAVGVSILLLSPTTFHESTSYAAHGWGFLIGIVVGFLLIPLTAIHEQPAPRAPGA